MLRMSQVRRYLTPVQVAKRLHVTPETVRAWARAGKIRFITLPSGRMRFPEEEFADLDAGEPVADDEPVAVAS